VSAAEQLMHDVLLTAVSHESHPADCPFCAAAAHDEEAPVATDDDIKAAVDKATADAAAEITDLKAKLANHDRAATEAAVAELQTKLDEAVAARKSAEEQLTAVTAYLEAEHAKAAEAAAAAARRDERVEAVRATAVFPDSYVDDNADRWARLAEDAWTTQLGEYQAIAASRPAPSDTPVVDHKPPPAPSPVTAAADTGTDPRTAVADVLALRTSGIDLRQII
jgi:hypothetical protein